MNLKIPPTSKIADVERALIAAALAHHAGNKAATARSLGVSLKTLYNKLNAYETARSV